MIKQCFFCKSGEGIGIINVRNIGSDTFPVCEVCYNQARRSIDGLEYKGKIIRLR